MNLDSQNNIDLPVSVREGLEHFCNQLRNALGEQLVSVVLYGGLTKGEYAHQGSDVNVMVVLNSVTVELLDKVVAPVQQGVRDFRLAIMLLSENDLRRTTNVFPIKFLDMQQHHHVLWGKEVFTDLRVGKDHLRFRCEQEIKNLLLRLRQFYLERAHRSELIEATLTGAVSSFLASLRALLILKTGDAPTGKDAIAAAGARELGLDDKPLQDVLALKSGTYKPDAAEQKRLYNAFMGAVEKAADIVERV